MARKPRTRKPAEIREDIKAITEEKRVFDAAIHEVMAMAGQEATPERQAKMRSIVLRHEKHMPEALVRRLLGTSAPVSDTQH